MKIVSAYFLILILLQSCIKQEYNNTKSRNKINGEWYCLNCNDFFAFEDSFLFSSQITPFDPVFKKYMFNDDTLIISHAIKNEPLEEKYLIDLNDNDFLRLIRVPFGRGIDTLVFVNTRRIKKNDIVPKQIILKTTSCFGHCPVLEFNLIGSELTIKGIHNTKHIGNFKYKLTREQLQRITDKINLLEIKENHIEFLPYISDAWHCDINILSDKDKVISGNGRIGTLEQGYVISYLAHLESILKMGKD